MVQSPTSRTAYRALSAVAPPFAAELAYRAFRTVGPPAAVRPADRPVHDRARRREVTVRGERVVTYSWGDASAPPVLLVHGWQLRASRFATLVRALEGSGMRPVAFDALAHGESGGRWTTVVEQMATMRAVQAVEGHFAGVIGHSFGGLAAGLALHDGFDADRFVAIAAPTGFDAVLDSFMRLGALPPRVAAPLRRRIIGRLFADQHDPRTTLDLALNPAPGSVPTVFVQDDTDVRTRPDEARRLHAAHPGSRLVLTHGLGHNRILDDPAVIETVVEHVTATVGAPTV